MLLLASPTFVLGVGAIAGIGVASALCLLLVIFVIIFALRRRRKRHPPCGTFRSSSEISTICRLSTDASTIQRQIQEALHQPARSAEPPPYAVRHGAVGGSCTEVSTTDEAAAAPSRGGSGSLAFDDPPPPYDVVINDNPSELEGRMSNVQGCLGEGRRSSRSQTPAAETLDRSRRGQRNQRSRLPAVQRYSYMSSSEGPSSIDPLESESNFSQTESNVSRFSNLGSEHIYEDPRTLASVADDGPNPQQLGLKSSTLRRNQLRNNHSAAMMQPLSRGADASLGSSVGLNSHYGVSPIQMSSPSNYDLDLAGSNAASVEVGPYHISPIVPTPAPSRHSGLFYAQPSAAGYPSLDYPGGVLSHQSQSHYPAATSTLPSQRAARIRLGTTALGNRPDSANRRQSRRSGSRELPVSQPTWQPSARQPDRRDQHQMQTYFDGSSQRKKSASRSSFTPYRDEASADELRQSRASHGRRPSDLYAPRRQEDPFSLQDSDLASFSANTANLYGLRNQPTRSKKQCSDLRDVPRAASRDRLVMQPYSSCDNASVSSHEQMLDPVSNREDQRPRQNHHRRGELTNYQDKSPSRPLVVADGSADVPYNVEYLYPTRV